MSDLSRVVLVRSSQRRRRVWGLPRRSLASTAVAVVLAVVAALLSFVVSAGPAQAAVGVSGTRTVSGFPRWFEDAGGTRLEPCFENDPARCVLLADAGFDPAQPLVFPTNFPGEFFYSIVDSDVIATPGCQGTRPGKALVRLALEGAFAGGVPVPGDQMVFARTRVTATGLCPNAAYTFTHPYGRVTLTTDVDGQLARNQATTDVGCIAGGCTFTEPLTAQMFRGFLRWDPAVAPAATPGYLSGDATVLHPIVGASGVGSANLFRVSGPSFTASTNLFTVAAKVAGPLHSTPEAADFGNQPVNVASPARTVTFTNVSQAPMTLTGASISPATAPWQVTASTCSGALAANATCTVTLVFAPTTLGAVSADLQIGHNSFRTPTALPLSGAGTAAVAPDVTSAPGTVDFRRTAVGAASTAQGVVVHNNGPGSYVVDGVSIVDDVAGGGFTGDSAKYLPIAGNDCPAAGLAPGLSCTVTVALTPTDQRPTRARLQVAGHVGATSVPLTATLTGRGGIATSSAAGGVGPAGKGTDGFPTWYQDDRGVRVKQCFLNDPTRCVLLAEPGFNPAAPVSFPANYPSEAFYYIADSDQMTTPGCGPASPAGRAGFRAAVEQTFTSGAVTAGEQMVFDRVRVNVTSGLCVGRQYTFVHPYGEFTFTADDQGGLPRSPGTIDTGCAPAPGGVCDFNLATASPVSDGFLRWDAVAPAAPAGFLGDPNVLHTVAGAPYTRPGAATPQNRVEIIDTTDGSVVASTNLFTVSGQLDPTQTTTRYTNTAPSAYPQLSAGQPVDFGTRDVATTSAPKTFTVESVGTTALTATAPTVTGTNAGDFRVTANTCATVAVGAACTLTVTFTPTGPGTRRATLTIPSNAANPWNGTVRLTGTGVGAPAPGISVSPPTVDFGDRLTGTAGPATPVTVTNTGDLALHVTGLTLGGADAGQFTATGCTAAIPPGASCDVQVTFTPTTDGAKAATVTFVSDAPGSNPVVPLTGTGVRPALTLSAPSVDFGGVRVGTTPPAKAVTVTNSGGTPLTVSGLALSGANAAEFTASGCVAPVAPGGTCSIVLTFTPAADGARSATVTVTSNAAAATIALTGTGGSPAATLTPAALAFGQWAVNRISAPLTVTVTNTGTAPMVVSTVSVTGTNAVDFTPTNTCTVLASLPAGAWCTVDVTFRPGGTGARAGTLTVVTDAGTRTVAMTGTGGGTSAFTLTPTAVPAFATTVVGSTSPVQTVTVTDTGTAQLAVNSVTLAGVSPQDYTIVSNTCTVALPNRATCTIGVAFRPTTTGTRTATLSVATSDGTLNRTLTGLAPTVPNAPVIRASTVGAASLTANWTAPTVNGGSAVTGYQVRVVTGGVQVGALLPAPATATSLLVTGLTPGVSYQVQVQAVNVVGAGAFSALSAATLVPAVPGAPTIGTATNGSTANATVEATGTWTAPTATGGAAITGYVVHAVRMSSAAADATPVSETTVTVAATIRSRVVTGLVAGAPYRFRVEAVNLAGTSATSALSNVVTAN